MSEKTLINLTKAFVGESQARNRYTFYSKIAKKEGYEQIAEIFLITADQEKQHAKRLFVHIQELKKVLGNNEEIQIETSVPTTYGTTIENLKAAIAGETYEETEMYPEFAKVAEEEGLEEIATRLRSIAIAEKNHKERYEQILKQLTDGTFFKKTEEQWWVCRECGYVHFGIEPPEECPSCDHAKSYYELRNNNF